MMEEEFAQEIEKEEGCKNCGTGNVEEGHTIPLCTECRNTISKRPFPLWVKMFLLVLTAIFIVSLFNFPKVLEAGVAYERGIKYEKQLKYASATREFEKTTTIYPDSTEALCKLIVSYYNSGDIYNAASTFDIVAGREFSNEKLIDEVNTVISKIDELYVPTEPFIKMTEAAGDVDVNGRIEKILEYSKTNNLNNYEKSILASCFYDVGNFDECKRITKEIVDAYPDYIDGNLLLAAVEREKENYDIAIDYCNNVLNLNVENCDAIAAKARIELKRFNDSEAIDLALEAYSISPNNAYVVSTLALAYHFNEMIDKREELMKLFEDGTINDEYSLDMLKAVFKGGEKWRG